ncbi:cysteine-rich CWC family protein [Flectobacillus major]|uniref:cysteine-rich CWC family protein n=1 Tax=Flectobacillus major TaxID=103 RepID=UPI0003F9F1FD
MDTTKPNQCPHCQQGLECKVDEIASCECQKVHLSYEETQIIRKITLERYQGQCLCNNCIEKLKRNILTL